VNTQSGNPIAFSPDGQRLAAAGDDGAVMVWSLAAARSVMVLGGHTGQVYDVVFSPDGRRLATAGDDTTVKLWDAADGAEVFTLRGHTGAVLGVAFSPDGRCLASASIDRTMRIWELDPPAEEVARRRWIVAQAERLLTQLLDREGLPRDHAVARLRENSTFAEAVRGAALSIAGLLPAENPLRLSEAAWRIVLSQRPLPENSRGVKLRALAGELLKTPNTEMPNGRDAFAQ